MKSRAVYLERGIREMLADPKGDGMAKAFYEHPLIYSLFQGTFVPKEKRVLGGGLPTYIPAKDFAQANHGSRDPRPIPVRVCRGAERSAAQRGDAA